MWEEILNQTYDKQSGLMQNKIGLNPVQVEESVFLAGESTLEVLSREAKAGNIDQIISLFRGKHQVSTSHPLSGEIEQVLVEKLKNRQGFSTGVAQEVHHTTVPYILSQVKSRMLGEGTAPSTENLNALFGGPGVLSAGMQDKLKKEFRKEV